METGGSYGRDDLRGNQQGLTVRTLEFFSRRIRLRDLLRWLPLHLLNVSLFDLLH